MLQPKRNATMTAAPKTEKLPGRNPSDSMKLARPTSDAATGEPLTPKKPKKAPRLK